MYRILIVEDDEIIAKAVEAHLSGWGYEVHCVQEFQNIMPEFTAFAPHLVLLDIALPFFNGHHWCREIRQVSKVPIIFVTSSSDNTSVVLSMHMGGDDLIAKPFDLGVLTAKVQATLRRTYDFTGQTALLAHRGAILNVDDATLTYEGQTLNLTKNEYRILYTLMEQKGKTVTRDRLMEKLWESDSYVDENTLSVNVNRLRKRLEEVGLSDFIVTKKGLGYLVE